MSVYRICPFGLDEFKVQHKWLGLVWTDVTRWRYEWTELVAFDTVGKAKIWINEALKRERTAAHEKLARRLRKRQWRPQVYP